MSHIFNELADGREDLQKWFNIVHCDVCHEFTDEPLFLHCQDIHTICPECMHRAQAAGSKECPSCSHEYELVDPIAFKAHALALINLVEVELPERSEELQLKLEEKRNAAKSLRESKENS